MESTFKSNFILCGLPKSGKTTVGKILADALNLDFIDTDRLIEESYFSKTFKDFSCREIFANDGSTLFREFEKQEIASLKDVKNSVIAIGGGSLTLKENIQVLKRIGRFIYLKTPLEELLVRMEKEKFSKNSVPAYLNPNHLKESFQELAEKRIPIFEKMADYAIDTSSLNEFEVSLEILRQYNRLLSKPQGD